jgi:hypothetical protein
VFLLIQSREACGVRRYFCGEVAIGDFLFDLHTAWLRSATTRCCDRRQFGLSLSEFRAVKLPILPDVKSHFQRLSGGKSRRTVRLGEVVVCSGIGDWSKGFAHQTRHKLAILPVDQGRSR